MALVLARAEVCERTALQRRSRSRLHQDVNYVAVLIDRAPEILQVAVDSKEDFVQMPVVPEPALSSLQLVDIICAELLAPQPDGFVGYDNAAFRQKIFDISEA